MSSSIFTVLQTIATLSGAAAMERFNAHDYVTASILAAVCIASYAAYELIPAKSSTPPQQ